jgi:inorganic pyrophosphatase
MANLAQLPNKLDKKNRQCRVIIETPKGCRNKFDYDPETELFGLGGLLPAGLSFPYDFGFVPSTLGDDGDPLDLMIFMEEPAHVGCLLEVRVIGVIEAVQAEDGKKMTNNRLLGVSVHSYSKEDFRSVQDVPKAELDQIQEFFVSYNKSRGKRFTVKGIHGPKRALELIEAGIKLYNNRANR